MFFRCILGEKNPKCGSGGRKSTYCDATDSLPTAQLVKSGLNVLSMLLIYHKYIDEVGKQTRWSFSAAFWAKKNPKYGSGGRKSTYCDKTDYQTTAHQAKLGLNPIALLLIYHKYIHEVGKLSRRFFSRSILGKKISEMWIWGTKIDILWCDRLRTYRSTSQIGFKSSLIASYRTQIHISSRITTETMFFRNILGEKIRNMYPGDENRHIVIRPISNLPINKSNWV